MPPRRGRPKKGDRRIDAAIDHFAAMGYAARDVQDVVDRLLKLYGSADAWPLLEEGSYQLVLDLLIEKQQEEEKQKQQLLLEHKPQAEEQQVEAVGQEPPQNQGLAEDKAPPGNSMAMLEMEVSAESESPDEGVKDPVSAELPALQVAVPHPIATRKVGTRRPCYGWISESDDEE